MRLYNGDIDKIVREGGPHAATRSLASPRLQVEIKPYVLDDQICDERAATISGIKAVLK